MWRKAQGEPEKTTDKHRECVCERESGRAEKQQRNKKTICKCDCVAYF